MERVVGREPVERARQNEPLELIGAWDEDEHRWALVDQRLEIRMYAAPRVYGLSQ